MPKDDGTVDSEDFFVFSGNNHFSSNKEGKGKGTYEIVRADQGKDFIVFTYDNASVIRYSYSRAENKIRINDWLYIKQ